MNLRIAIQPDRVVHANGEVQSYSARWQQLAREYGVKISFIDAWSHGVLEEISDCDALMWRFSPNYLQRSAAERLLTAVELGLRRPVFPDRATRWHVEDKLAQHAMFEALELPTPRTWVFHERERALSFLESVEYPLVIKLSAGIQSSNVRLVRDVSEGRYYVEALFGAGMASLAYGPAGWPRLMARRVRHAAGILAGRSSPPVTSGQELHRNYCFFQEFIPWNDHDTRVTIVGDRAYAFRRFNRPNDFRASGSGIIDWNSDNIDLEMIRMAFMIVDRLRAQTLGVDFVYRNGEPVVLELTLTYASWALRDCPGHWRRFSGAGNDLKWQPGTLEPADAIFTDFVERLRAGE